MSLGATATAATDFAPPLARDAARAVESDATRLTAAARRDFAAILGPEDVSDDPSVLCSYSWCYTVMRGDPPDRLISPIKPTAVVLPESTAEVQAVVRACIQHGLGFRAHSTGVGSFGNVVNESSIVVDLRKMNRIVRLDARNQMAVIEPYVTAQQLMAEAMKVGLTPHVIGAGWTHSPLASATSFVGVGPSGNLTAQNSRNLLGVEWVDPDGELVRIGAPGCSDDWFAGEGPGPGFRGMIRGFMGASGELGIFTRIGYKLHPWAGPAQLEHRGSNPQFGIALSDTMRMYYAVWPDWAAHTRATHELMRANAATYVMRQPPDMVGWLLYGTNREFCKRWISGDIAPVARNENKHAWTLLTVCENVAEAEWRDRTIRQIVADTGGRFIAVDPDQAEQLARNVVTTCYVPRLYRAAPRGVFTSVGIMDSPSLLPDVMTMVEKTLKPYKEKYKTLAQGSPEEMWLWTSEGRQMWGENAVIGDNSRVASWADIMAYSLDITADHAANPLGMNCFIGSNDLVDTFQAHFKTNIWLRRMKEIFDPHRRSDGMMMPYGPISPFAKAWPVINLLRRYFPLPLRLGLRDKIRKDAKAKLRRSKLPR